MTTAIIILLVLGIFAWGMSKAHRAGKDSADSDRLEGEIESNLTLEEEIDKLEEEYRRLYEGVDDGDAADRLRKQGRRDAEDV